MTFKKPYWVVLLGVMPVVATGAFAQSTASPETYQGTIRAQDFASLSYGVRGCIIEIDEAAKDAAMANAGQVLVRLDDRRQGLAVSTANTRVDDLAAAAVERGTGLQAAMAEHRRAKESLDFVAKEFERNKSMLGRGLINETALEAVERRFMDAKFAEERALEAITSAEAAQERARIALEIGKLEAETAALALEDHVVTAPLDGVLIGFEAKVGDCIQEGGLAAQMYRPAEKSVDVFVQVRRLTAPDNPMTIGAKVQVARVNGDTCGGTLTRFGTEANTETQFVEATIDLDPSCAPDLFLNEAVTVSPVGSEES